MTRLITASPRRAVWTIGAAFTAALLGVMPFLGDKAFVATYYYYDDNFYYFQIARNLACGRGFTFDGIHRTNGFHPLWQLLLVPLFGAFTGDVAPLRVVAALETALIVLSGIGVFRILLPRLGADPALAAALLLVAQPGSARVLRAGMESSLFLLALVVVWRRWLSVKGAQAPARTWRLGAWCALAFLARLEAVVTLPALLLLGRRRFASEPRSILALAAPTALCAALYLTWNRLAFDTWLPVSAMVKASWAEGARWAALVRQLPAAVQIPWIVEAAFRRLFGRPLAGTRMAKGCLLVLLALALAAGWRRRRFLVLAVRRSGASFVLLFAALFVSVHALAVGHVEVWQRVPLVLATSVLAGAILFRQPRAARAAALAALVATIARVPLTAWHGSHVAASPTGATVVQTIEAADWLRRNTVNSDRIASWSSAGMLGYFSHRPVVNLDGLVNDVSFFATVVREGRLEGYLRRERIRFLADSACGPVPSFPDALARSLRSPSMRSSREEAGDVLRNRFDPVKVIYDVGARDGCPGLAIWEAHWVVPEAPPPRHVGGGASGQG